MTVAPAALSVTYIRVYLENVMMFSVRTVVRANLLDRILARPGALHLPEPTGELVNRFRDDAGEIMGYIWWPGIVIGQVVFAAAAITIMARIHALMTLTVVVPLFLVVGIAQLASSRLQHYRRAPAAARRVTSPASLARPSDRFRRSRSPERSGT